MDPSIWLAPLFSEFQSSFGYSTVASRGMPSSWREPRERKNQYCLTEARIWQMLGHMPIKRRSAVREQHVKLFRNGRNQAVRIPREFELPGNDAIMRKEGDRLIIETAPPKSLLTLLDKLSPIDEQFPPIVELASDTVDL